MPDHAKLINELYIAGLGFAIISLWLMYRAVRRAREYGPDTRFRYAYLLPIPFLYLVGFTVVARYGAVFTFHTIMDLIHSHKVIEQINGYASLIMACMPLLGGLVVWYIQRQTEDDGLEWREEYDEDEEDEDYR